MTKQELLDKLTAPDDSHDPEMDHVRAERWLIAFVNDSEIEAAWDKRADHWWYA
jgi:hypothetical protein